jgi:glycerol-3-phosphate dehydrogenase
MYKEWIFMETQVVIIGAGIMGAALARELAKYDVDVTLVEKRADVSMSVTKASNATIYSPLNFSWVSSSALKEIATKKAGITREAELEKEKLCIDGANSWGNLLDELDLDYLKFPYFMVVATNEDDLKVLELMEKGAQARWSQI